MDGGPQKKVVDHRSQAPRRLTQVSLDTATDIHLGGGALLSVTASLRVWFEVEEYTIDDKSRKSGDTRSPSVRSSAFEIVGEDVQHKSASQKKSSSQRKVWHPRRKQAGWMCVRMRRRKGAERRKGIQR